MFFEIINRDSNILSPECLLNLIENGKNSGITQLMTHTECEKPTDKQMDAES